MDSDWWIIDQFRGLIPINGRSSVRRVETINNSTMNYRWFSWFFFWANGWNGGEIVEISFKFHDELVNYWSFSVLIPINGRSSVRWVETINNSTMNYRWFSWFFFWANGWNGGEIVEISFKFHDELVNYWSFSVLIPINGRSSVRWVETINNSTMNYRWISWLFSNKWLKWRWNTWNFF